MDEYISQFKGGHRSGPPLQINLDQTETFQGAKHVIGLVSVTTPLIIKQYWSKARQRMGQQWNIIMKRNLEQQNL